MNLAWIYGNKQGKLRTNRTNRTKDGSDLTNQVRGILTNADQKLILMVRQ